MPAYRQGVDAQGRPLFVRPPYAAAAYTAEPNWVPELRASYQTYNPKALLADPQGPFGGFSRIREIERGGKRYAVLLKGGKPEWGLEVELTEGNLGELNELPPEDGWKLARELDAKANPPIEVGPIDPAKL